MAKPKVNTKCVASQYASPNERIIEFSDAKGNGGLISLSTDEDGILNVYVYRCDDAVRVRYQPRTAKR